MGFAAVSGPRKCPLYTPGVHAAGWWTKGDRDLTERLEETASPVAEPPLVRPTPWLALAIIIVAAFVYRLILGYYLHDYVGDSQNYFALAQNLAHGHGYSVGSYVPYLASDTRWPAYPAFLAAAFVIHDSHWSAIVLNALLGTVATWLVYLIARALRLREALALAATAVAALFIATASFAGDLAAENLSVPAVLALVYVVLLNPPRRRLWLFVGGTLLAWLAALTRQELLVFAVIAAILAGRHLRLGFWLTALLVACFLVGPAAWVVRNDVTVHRLEYTDSIQADEAYLVAVNDNEGSPLYREGEAMNPRFVPPSVRDAYQHAVIKYDEHFLEHHFATFLEDKIKAGVEYPFITPVYGPRFDSGLMLLARLAWSLVLAAEYVLALIAAWHWWKGGRRWDTIAMGVFPVFALLLIVVDNPEPRYWLPADLLLVPAAFAGATFLTTFQRAFKRQGASPPVEDRPGLT